jgi:methyl-accepting chemotaxis protein
MLQIRKFKYKVGLLPLLAAVSFIVIFAVNQYLGSQSTISLRAVEDGYFPALETDKELETTLSLLQRQIQDAVAAQDTELLAESEGLRTSFMELLDSVKENPVADLNKISALEEQFSDYYSLAVATAELMIEQASNEDVVAESVVDALESMSEKYNEIRLTLDTNAQNSRQGMTVAFASAHKSQKTNMSVIGIVTIACLFLLVAISYWIIRSVNKTLTQAGRDAERIAQQISSAAKQQSGASSETATSVSETATTVGEISKTSDLAAEKAKAVADTADKASASSESSREAISRGAAAMSAIHDEVENTASQILDLSQKNLQIGEIVQSVNAIAEQSNLLAVNASIEAAKAGEQGKGFSVVAGEVKALAGQSKEATDQIRTILSEIQKASNTAVMITEQSVKRVGEGSRIIEELGVVLDEAGNINEESTDAAKQIAMITNQQQVGLEQISDAMRSIEKATQGNAAGAQQLEVAAQQVQELSMSLTSIIDGR